MMPLGDGKELCSCGLHMNAVLYRPRGGPRLRAFFRTLCGSTIPLEEEPLASPCYASPKTVTPVITHDSLLLHFLPHTVCHLCYDGARARAQRPSTRQGGHAVDFVAVVDQVIALLRQRGRVAYRTLKLQFQPR